MPLLDESARHQSDGEHKSKKRLSLKMRDNLKIGVLYECE